MDEVAVHGANDNDTLGRADHKLAVAKAIVKARRVAASTRVPNEVPRQGHDVPALGSISSAVDVAIWL